jgi:hypothetical protein
VQFHFALAIHLVLRIQERQMVARADKLIQVFDAEALGQVDDGGLNTGFRQETPGLAAGCSRGFDIQCAGHGRSTDSIVP